MKNSIMVLSIVLLFSSASYGMQHGRGMQWCNGDYSEEDALALTKALSENDVVAPMTTTTTTDGGSNNGSDEDELIAMAMSLSLASVVQGTPIALTTTTTTQNPATETAECPICLDDKVEADFCTLACGDKCCNECLKVIVEAALNTHNTVGLKCPIKACSKPLDMADIAKFVGEKAKLEQLGDIQFQEYLAAQPNSKHCPTPNCEFCFINEDRHTETCPICHVQFCSECLLNHSNRITCAEAKENQKLSDNHKGEEDATQQLIAQTSKPCPACKVHIEKTEGCNHMRCGNCNHEFCWLCGQDWNSTGRYQHVCPGATNPTWNVGYNHPDMPNNENNAPQQVLGRNQYHQQQPPVVVAQYPGLPQNVPLQQQIQQRLPLQPAPIVLQQQQPQPVYGNVVQPVLPLYPQGWPQIVAVRRYQQFPAVQGNIAQYYQQPNGQGLVQPPPILLGQGQLPRQQLQPPPIVRQQQQFPPQQ